MQKIANFNGINGVKNKLKEESAELIEAIESNDLERVVDELADVIVVIEQIKYLYDLKDSNLLKNRIDFKVRRTIKRIVNGYYKK